MIQPTAINRPSILNDGLNSNAVVQFLGSPEYLYNSGGLGYSQEQSVFVVVKRDGSNTNDLSNITFYLNSGVADGGNAGRDLQLSWNDADGFRQGVGNGRTGDSSLTHTRNDSFNIHSLTIRKTSGIHYGYLNGGDEQSQANTAAGVVGDMDLLLGAGSIWSRNFPTEDPLYHAPCKIAEVIFIDAQLGAADRQKIEGYLAHKWGLAASLPAEHPYKDAAPILPSLFGTITDKDGNPVERRITVLDATGHCVATDTSDPVTGAYSIAVPAESPYTLVFDGEPDRNAQVFANVIPGDPPA